MGRNLTIEKQKAEKQCDEWNKKYPEGTPVIFQKFKPDGEKIETVTRSVAWEASCQPLVLLKGISGGCHLDFIEVPKCAGCLSTLGESGGCTNAECDGTAVYGTTSGH